MPLNQSPNIFKNIEGFITSDLRVALGNCFLQGFRVVDASLEYDRDRHKLSDFKNGRPISDWVTTSVFKFKMEGEFSDFVDTTQISPVLAVSPGPQVWYVWDRVEYSVNYPLMRDSPWRGSLNQVMSITINAYGQPKLFDFSDIDQWEDMKIALAVTSKVAKSIDYFVEHRPEFAGLPLGIIKAEAT